MSKSDLLNSCCCWRKWKWLGFSPCWSFQVKLDGKFECEKVFVYNKTCWTSRPTSQLDRYLMWKLGKLSWIFFLCDSPFQECFNLNLPCYLFTINWHSWQSAWWVDPEFDWFNLLGQNLKLTFCQSQLLSLHFDQLFLNFP